MKSAVIHTFFKRWSILISSQLKENIMSQVNEKPNETEFDRVLEKDGPALDQAAKEAINEVQEGLGDPNRDDTW